MNAEHAFKMCSGQGLYASKQYQTFQEAQDIIEQFLSGVVRVVVRKFPISIFHHACLLSKEESGICKNLDGMQPVQA